MDFEKLGNAFAEALKNIMGNKEVGETSEKAEVSSEPVKEPEKEEPKKENVIEVDPRDKRIKELEELLAQKNDIISQNSEQINALKELTSVNATPDSTELSIEELIRKGEF